MTGDPLFPFQEHGITWLEQGSFRFLADEMGLGKSVQTVLAKPPSERALVVCPAGLRVNWEREVYKWTGLVPLLLERFSDEPSATAIWTACSYEYATENASKLEAMRYDVLVLDEAHYVCRRDAARSDAIFGRDGASGIARSCARTWWLTGTPILTSPADLWLPFRFSGHTELTYQQWLDEFCEVKPSGSGRFFKLQPCGLKQSAGPKLQALIKNSGFVLRRLKEDVLKDLPPLFYQQQYVEPHLGAAELPLAMGAMSREQADLEAALVRHAMEGEDFKTNELAVLQGLAQSCTTLRRYLGLQKVPAAAELVRSELSSNQYPKILVACEFLDSLSAMALRLEPFGIGMIRGDTVQEARYAILDRFASDSSLRVLLMQTRAGGVGINAIAADQVLVVECPWTPAQLQQLVARCHRIGQTRAVTARVLTLSNDPMDEAIVRLVIRRARDIKLVLSDERN